MGPTKSDVSVFKASKCTSGTHSVTYTPNVRGEYSIDVKLPSVFEVQRVTTFISSEDSLGGAFSLTYHDEQGIDLESGTIAFDADETSVQMAIEDIESIDSVSVSLHECDNPTVSCSWDITFLSLEGDVNMLEPNVLQLVGDLSDIQVEEVVKGRSSKSITGFPTTIDVSPGDTNPSWTTAYGKGLVLATAGELSTFAIQPKDAFGNDRLAEQSADLFEVFIYPEQGKDDGSVPIMKGIVQRESVVNEASGDVYSVFSATTEALKADQLVSTHCKEILGGHFTLSFKGQRTTEILFNASASDVKQKLEQLSSVGIVQVTRHHFNEGFEWAVTFLDHHGNEPLLSVDDHLTCS